MKILLTVLILISTSVLADLPFQPRITWTPPTQYTDNSPLDPLVDLVEYKLDCTGPVNINLSLSNLLIEYEAPLGQFVAGSYSCTMAAVATNGGVSANSLPVNFTVDLKVPRPVINFGVL